jgi:nicotinamide riboside kinase
MDCRSPAVEAIARRQDHPFYLVTGDEIAFAQDGTRDGEHIRHAMQARILERLGEAGKRHVLLAGSRGDRLQQAVRAIDTFLRSAL